MITKPIWIFLLFLGIAEISSGSVSFGEGKDLNNMFRRSWDPHVEERKFKASSPNEFRSNFQLRKDLVKSLYERNLGNRKNLDELQEQTSDKSAKLMRYHDSIMKDFNQLLRQNTKEPSQIHDFETDSSDVQDGNFKSGHSNDLRSFEDARSKEFIRNQALRRLKHYISKHEELQHDDQFLQDLANAIDKRATKFHANDGTDSHSDSAGSSFPSNSNTGSLNFILNRKSDGSKASSMQDQKASAVPQDKVQDSNASGDDQTGAMQNFNSDYRKQTSNDAASSKDESSNYFMSNNYEGRNSGDFPLEGNLQDYHNQNNNFYSSADNSRNQNQQQFYEKNDKLNSDSPQQMTEELEKHSVALNSNQEQEFQQHTGEAGHEHFEASLNSPDFSNFQNKKASLTEQSNHLANDLTSLKGDSNQADDTEAFNKVIDSEKTLNRRSSLRTGNSNMKRDAENSLGIGSAKLTANAGISDYDRLSFQNGNVKTQPDTRINEFSRLNEDSNKDSSVSSASLNSAESNVENDLNLRLAEDLYRILPESEKIALARSIDKKRQALGEKYRQELEAFRKNPQRRSSELSYPYSTMHFLQEYQPKNSDSDVSLQSDYMEKRNYPRENPAEQKALNVSYMDSGLSSLSSEDSRVSLTNKDSNEKDNDKMANIYERILQNQKDYERRSSDLNVNNKHLMNKEVETKQENMFFKPNSGSSLGNDPQRLPQNLESDSGSNSISSPNSNQNTNSFENKGGPLDPSKNMDLSKFLTSDQNPANTYMMGHVQTSFPNPASDFFRISHDQQSVPNPNTIIQNPLQNAKVPLHSGNNNMQEGGFMPNMMPAFKTQSSYVIFPNMQGLNANNQDQQAFFLAANAPNFQSPSQNNFLTGFNNQNSPYLGQEPSMNGKEMTRALNQNQVQNPVQIQEQTPEQTQEQNQKDATGSLSAPATSDFQKANTMEYLGEMKKSPRSEAALAFVSKLKSGVDHLDENSRAQLIAARAYAQEMLTSPKNSRYFDLSDDSQFSPNQISSCLISPNSNPMLYSNPQASFQKSLDRRSSNADANGAKAQKAATGTLSNTNSEKEPPNKNQDSNSKDSQDSNAPANLKKLSACKDSASGTDTATCEANTPQKEKDNSNKRRPSDISEEGVALPAAESPHNNPMQIQNEKDTGRETSSGSSVQLNGGNIAMFHPGRSSEEAFGSEANKKDFFSNGGHVGGKHIDTDLSKIKAKTFSAASDFSKLKEGVRSLTDLYDYSERLASKIKKAQEIDNILEGSESAARNLDQAYRPSEIWKKSDLDYSNLHPNANPSCSDSRQNKMSRRDVESFSQCKSKNSESNCPSSASIDLPQNPKEKGSNIAQKAALDAKAAQEAQMPAGEAAAQQVRQQLAEKAIQAAQAAEAALAGKQQVVQQLECEFREAEALAIDQQNSLAGAQSNVEAAKKAAEAAEIQYGNLRRAVQTAKAQVCDAEAAATGVQQALTEKGNLLETAKRRVDSLSRQLAAARQDYEVTKQAAYRAVCAAAEAKQKANRVCRMLRRRHARYLRNITDDQVRKQKQIPKPAKSDSTQNQNQNQNQNETQDRRQEHHPDKHQDFNSNPALVSTAQKLAS